MERTCGRLILHITLRGTEWPYPGSSFYMLSRMVEKYPSWTYTKLTFAMTSMNLGNCALEVSFPRSALDSVGESTIIYPANGLSFAAQRREVIGAQYAAGRSSSWLDLTKLRYRPVRSRCRSGWRP